ncbi:MAG: sigma 54-interacting transcriptional regulator [Thermodesulfobacteriota bacterium]|nr:sigma 54-interacting transcriptional regulator [Thermodesulfobacteriota bacterium]
MPKTHRLKSDEREFFSLVNQAVLANPFSDERAEIDRKIAGLFPGTARDVALEKAINGVGRRLAIIEKSGRGNISLFSGTDRKILMIAYLYVMFHQFIDRLDTLISDQLNAGKTSLKVAFADEMIAFLEKRGFDRQDILHYIALSFQIRRAYFFIDRGLVGRSSCMQKLREGLWNNVFTYDIDLYNEYLWSRMEDFSTIVLGETGTGKGTAAKAIGQSGFIPFDEKKGCFKESFARTFLSLNISQFSESLIESELFGHKKGAFTGAVEAHRGVFDQCSPHGAIFLDEIGEVLQPLQIKLLKVLEERIFSPVGSHEEHRFEGRIIAATNRPLEEIQTRAFFRSDFFYRLCSDIIKVPPLRERLKEDPGELDDLLAYTVEKIIGKPSPELVKMVQKRILKQLGKDYPWPGNVRELGQCVRRILLKRSYTLVTYPTLTETRSGLAAHVDNGDLCAQELLKEYCRLLYDRHGTLGEVARLTKLDRRTVKKYIG